MFVYMARGFIKTTVITSPWLLKRKYYSTLEFLWMNSDQIRNEAYTNYRLWCLVSVPQTAFGLLYKYSIWRHQHNFWILINKQCNMLCRQQNEIKYDKNVAACKMILLNDTSKSPRNIPYWSAKRLFIWMSFVLMQSIDILKSNYFQVQIIVTPNQTMYQLRS